MAKFPTLPTLYDDCLQFDISFLRKYDYLKPNQSKSGTITWSKNGNKIGSISIRVSIQTESPYIELDYICNETPINYRVQLFSAPSNIGKGVVWYFICPCTGRRCRKLYLADTYFYHRSAFTGCMYKTQTESKKYREITRMFKVYNEGNDYEKLNTKHFKQYYNGKPTKRFLKILKVIKQVENTLPNLLFDIMKH